MPEQTEHHWAIGENEFGVSKISIVKKLTPSREKNHGHKVTQNKAKVVDEDFVVTFAR